jgi:hypothetical protein
MFGIAHREIVCDIGAKALVDGAQFEILVAGTSVDVGKQVKTHCDFSICPVFNELRISDNRHHQCQNYQKKLFHIIL